MKMILKRFVQMLNKFRVVDGCLKWTGWTKLRVCVVDGTGKMYGLLDDLDG